MPYAPNPGNYCYIRLTARLGRFTVGAPSASWLPANDHPFYFARDARKHDGDIYQEKGGPLHWLWWGRWIGPLPDADAARVALEMLL